MFNKRIFALGFVCLAIVGLAWASAAAQENTAPISRTWTFTVKPGMEAQFEEAVKAHWEGRRQAGDTWTWFAYTIETGPNNGQYGFISPGHAWSDFDTYDAEHRDAILASFRENIAPYVASFRNEIRVGIPGLGGGGGGGVTTLVQVIDFNVRYGEEENFTYAIEKFDAAFQKAGMDRPYAWSQLVSGGTGPNFRLAVFHENWASMAGPGDDGFVALLENAFGAHEAEAVFASLQDSVWNTTSWVVRLRPDLAYNPGAEQ